MAAAGDAPGGDPDGAGVLGQRRGDPAGPLRLGRGRAGWPSGPRRPMRRSDAGPWGGGVARRAGPTSAAAGCGHQLPWEVETRWSPPGWSPMTPWPGPPSTAGGCGRARRRRPGRRARPTSCWSTATPPVRPGVTVAGVTHQLVPPQHSQRPSDHQQPPAEPPAGDAAKAPGAPSRRTCPLCLNPYRRVRRVVSLSLLGGLCQIEGRPGCAGQSGVISLAVAAKQPEPHRL